MKCWDLLIKIYLFCLLIFTVSVLSYKDDSIESAIEDGKFCLEKITDGQNQLKRTHPCYYQVL